MVLKSVRRLGLLSWKRSPARSRKSAPRAFASRSTSSNAAKLSVPRTASRSQYPRCESVATMIVNTSSSSSSSAMVVPRARFKKKLSLLM